MILQFENISDSNHFAAYIKSSIIFAICPRFATHSKVLGAYRPLIKGFHFVTLLSRRFLSQMIINCCCWVLVWFIDALLNFYHQFCADDCLEIIFDMKMMYLWKINNRLKLKKLIVIRKRQKHLELAETRKLTKTMSECFLTFWLISLFKRYWFITYRTKYD